MGLFSTLLHFINTVPNNTYPGVYDSSKDHDMLDLVFWWREMWHFLGGCLLGSLFAFLLPPLSIFVAIYLALFLKELIDDVPDQEGHIDFKNFLDPLFWALGAGMSAFLLPHLFH